VKLGCRQKAEGSTWNFRATSFVPVALWQRRSDVERNSIAVQKPESVDWLQCRRLDATIC
jgi:hypothetical protein